MEHFQAEVDKTWNEWLIHAVIPFTIPQKDTRLLNIDKKRPLHAEASA